MFSTTVLFLLYLDSTGFAAARIAVLVLREATIPALAMEMVCCSIASWRMERVWSSILSNSSMQQMPMSERTRAPDSRTISLVSGSRVTYAVRPTAEELVKYEECNYWGYNLKQ